MANESGLKCGCNEAESGSANGAKSDPAQLTSGASGIADQSAYDWQSEKCCVRQRLAHIFANACFPDVVFIVGCESHTQRIPAHKVILSAGSRFFEAMFSGTWVPKSDEIPLPEDDPVAFAAVVRYLYTDDIQLTVDTVAAVFQVAKKYCITCLANRCNAFLLKNLCPENAFTTLSQALFLQEQPLIDSSLEVIDWYPLKAFGAEGFTSIDLDTLCLVLKRDSLRIREIDLFQAVLRWSKAECVSQELEVNAENQVSVAKEAVRLIRFPQMSVKEFSSKEVIESGLLSETEALSMMLYFARKDESSLLFNKTPRSDPYLVVSRFTAINKSRVCVLRKGARESIEFKTDRNMLLKGVGLFGHPKGPASYDVSFSLLDKREREVVEEVFRNCHYNGTTQTFRILFNEPLPIVAHKVYRIFVKISGPDSHFGTRGLEEVCEKLPGPGNQSVKIQLFGVSTSSIHTNVSEGQIPELLFEL